MEKYVKQQRRSNAKLPHWPESGEYSEQVVGVTFHASSLESVAEWCDTSEQVLFAIATLEPDPSNPHDVNAVMVLCNGKQIGFLGRESAKAYGVTVSESPNVYAPPHTTAALRISQLQFDSGRQFSAALDLKFSKPPSDVDKVTPRLRGSTLLPRLGDQVLLREGGAFIASMNVPAETMARCWFGARLDVWLKDETGDVYVSAPGSIGGSGRLFFTDLSTLRKLGFGGVYDFDPYVYSAGGSVVVSFAKLPK